MSDEPLKIYLRLFDCVSRDDLYTKLKQIIKQFKPFEGRDKIEFSLAKFKQHEFGETVSTRMEKVVHECWYAYKTEQLSNYLKRNKPVVTYENPKLLELESGLEKFLYQHLFMDGIDLPELLFSNFNIKCAVQGTRYNPPGNMEHYSDFFFNMYFGNLTEAKEHMGKLSKDELKQAMNAREGYGQFSPIFAPIIGRKMVRIQDSMLLTDEQKDDIRLMYHGSNENKHFKILEMLLNEGADPNAHDTFGLTGLHYASQLDADDCERIASLLIRYGADVNSDKSLGGTCLLYEFVRSPTASEKVIEMLISNYAKSDSVRGTRFIRQRVETEHSVKLAVKVREALPKEARECERSVCDKETNKKCSACDSVVYCSADCQKQDWKFHKQTCKMRRLEKDFVSSSIQ